MTPPRTFIRAWSAWQHSVVPSGNFRLGRGDAPTYGVELGLGHLHSRLYSLGSSVIGGKRWDYAGLAAEGLAELDGIELELEGCDVPEGEKESFRSYISVARRLLVEMKSASSPNGAA